MADSPAEEPARTTALRQLAALLEPHGFSCTATGDGAAQVLEIRLDDRRWWVQWSDLTHAGAGHVASGIARRAGLSFEARAEILQLRRKLSST